MKTEDEETGRNMKALFLIGILGLMIVGFMFAVNAQSVPQGPDDLESVSNETKTPNSALEWNVSGGFVSTFNLTSSTQNPRWKGFVGNVTGSFTLDDSSGATLFDWTLTSVTGNVYATRNDSSIAWANVECANVTTLEAENVALEHSSAQDNLTATFNLSGTHDSFFVGSVFFGANSCPTLNTYVSDSAQDTSFEEMAIYSGPNTIIYATIMEEAAVGFDGGLYDFQAIVPENGNQSFSGATAYYLYIELT